MEQFASECMVLLGVALAFAGALMLISAYIRSKKGIQTTGTVKEIRKNSFNEHGRSFDTENPVVAFSIGGKEYEKELFIKKEPGVYREGQVLNLSVSGKKLDKIIVHGENSYYVKGIAMAVLGIVAISIGIGCFYGLQ